VPPKAWQCKGELEENARGQEETARSARDGECCAGVGHGECVACGQLGEEAQPVEDERL